MKGSSDFDIKFIVFLRVYNIVFCFVHWLLLLDGYLLCYMFAFDGKKYRCEKKYKRERKTTYNKLCCDVGVLSVWIYFCMCQRVCMCAYGRLAVNNTIRW